MVIRAGESVSLRLPEFIGPSFSGGAVESQPAGFVTACDWTEGTSMADPGVLRCPILITIAEWEFVNVTIPTDRGIQLPLNGVLKNNPAIQIETDAAAGQVIQSPLAFVEGVAAVSGLVKLFYTNPTALELTGLTLEFSIGFALFPGDKFTLTLPGFSSNRVNPGITASVLDNDGTYNVKGVWKNGSERNSSSIQCFDATLTFIVESEIPQNQITLNVEPVIYLPIDGVPQNAQFIRFGLDARWGALPPDGIGEAPLVLPAVSGVTLEALNPAA
eukprot:3109983-Rhodomonas_salina.1